MSEEAANKATELVAEVADEVAEQATQIAVFSRRLSGRELSLVFGGVIVGAGLGSVLGYIFCQRRLETKYEQIAQEEIATMRGHYQAKVTSLDAAVKKVDLEDIVREKGYAPAEETTPPMAVTPPDRVVEAAREAAEEEEAEEVSEPEVVEEEVQPAIRNVFQTAGEVDPTWDYHREKARRSPVRPYVIHVDERGERDWEETTLTYYEGDDVVCDSHDQILDHEEREKLLGEKNLERFGHGSNDPSIVYIRNDKFEMQFEVVKSPQSYVEEVHGFSHGDDRSNLERMRSRERQMYDDD